MIDTDRLSQLETTLHQKIRLANDAVKQPMTSEDITSIVRDVVSSLTGDITAADLKFYAELEELANFIRSAKREIAAIKPEEISEDHIPQATDELDAVVGATEEATNKIMDVCDTITGLAGSCSPEVNQQLIDCTTRIYEACNFQDITGQRITKVVQALKFIDLKVEALLAALGEEIGTNREKTKKLKEFDEKDLLNGPQLAHKAIDQDEIDRLLSEF